MTCQHKRWHEPCDCGDAHIMELRECPYCGAPGVDLPVSLNVQRACGPDRCDACERKRRTKGVKESMVCQGEVEGCDAEEVDCPCGGVMACSVHGHVDEGFDPDCPYWVKQPENKEEPCP